MKLETLLDYKQPTPYIVKSTEYCDTYPIPVLTAGQTFVLGYTNETFGIFKASKNDPTIIFDDFTTSFHWVDFDFKVKSSAMKMLTPKTNNSFRYIYYAMSCIGFVPTEHSRQWISKYSQFEIPLPPLPIQEAIVEILDKFESLQQGLQDELQVRKKQYEYYRNKLLTQFPDSVQVKEFTLGELFVFKNGLNAPKEKFGYGNPIVNYVNVYKKSSIITTDLSGKVDLEDSVIDRFRVHRGDVFFTRTSETKEEVGMASVMLDEVTNCVFSGFVLRARPITDFLYPEYCKYCFDTHEIRTQIIKSSTLTTRALTNGTSLSKVKIVVPSKQEQQRIVSILDHFETLVNDQEKGIPAEIAAVKKQYEFYRNKLLTF